jgi:hypothetical protein
MPTDMSILPWRKLLSLCREGDCLVYYFHPKGISYQSVNTNDSLFRGFQAKIEAWRGMLEYFAVHKMARGGERIERRLRPLRVLSLAILATIRCSPAISGGLTPTTGNNCLTLMTR